MTYKGKEADVFSAGVLLFSLVTGSLPFQKAQSDDHRFELIRLNQFDEFWSKLDSQTQLSKEFKDLIFSMLSENGNQRPTITTIRAHPWMQIESDCKDEIRELLIQYVANKR